MDLLQKIGAGNAPPLPMNTKVVVADEYNKLVEAINSLIQTINTNSYVSTKTVDLVISVDPVTIAGNSFNPPLIIKPSIGRAIQWTGDNGLDVSEIISGYVKNGSYYDVVITPLEDNYSNVTISII